MLFVLTEEPYHENSTVIGVFDNQAEAVSAFIAAPNLSPANRYDLPEVWELQAWEDGKSKSSLVIFSPQVSFHKEFGYGPVLPLGRCNYRAVDPFSFDFTIEEEPINQ